MDVAISIAFSMPEMLKRKPFMNRKELFKSGLTVGRDICGYEYVVFFAFFGGYLALLLWFGEIANFKIFSAEIIGILCAGMGVAIGLPLASGINAYLLTKKRKKR
ncbi:YibE/F family protein [Sporosarcina contaminans]|uniref:YibE/F family protein n=1 Tax=Sporosarcina contaminans TaxID=633403 RepID=A0ABW3U010_9BACL